IRMNAQRHLGMNAGRAPDAPDMAKAVAQKALRIFDTWADGGEAPVSHRSDYMGTLTRLTQAVLPSNLRVMFYETMFNKAAIDRLCGFLGIAPHPAAIDKPVNAGGGHRPGHAPPASGARITCPSVRICAPDDGRRAIALAHEYGGVVR
ncbi:MAG: hypothetical protein WBH04_12640, partial [Albidovulum sp.]